MNNSCNVFQIASSGDRLVVGQAVWHVSQQVASPHIEFQGDDYWWFRNWATDGTFTMSRWNVGEHVPAPGDTLRNYGMAW